MEYALPVIALVVKVLIVIVAVLTFVAYLTLIERKVLGWIQVRIGPNREAPGDSSSRLPTGQNYY